MGNDLETSERLQSAFFFHCFKYGGKNEACQYVVGLKMGDCFGFQSVMVE